MSNEYKDWCWDAAQDVILDNGLLNKIIYCDSFSGGYVIAGTDSNDYKRIFFVWLDEIDGWSYREIII